jgi:hypothetical protein
MSFKGTYEYIKHSVLKFPGATVIALTTQSLKRNLIEMHVHIWPRSATTDGLTQKHVTPSTNLNHF